MSTESRNRQRRLAGALLMASAALVGTEPAHAQQRLLLPEGTVLTVRTDTALSSTVAREGDAFRTTVTDSVRVEGFTVIPRGSKIDGVVTLARPATDQQSGVIGVEFTRLALPTGASVAIAGRLTSSDPAERRQIEADPNARVVFVGGRRGVGAAIGGIGAGSSNDPISGVLGTLGSLLSKGTDVTVPANTTLAVQLEQGLALRVVGPAARRPDAFTIFTSTDMIRAAQQALREQDYYQGPVDGQLDEATQRALFEYQIDNGIIATGNLDGRTAQALGLELGGAVGLTPSEATLVRRNAQVLTSRWREYLQISPSSRLDSRRFYRGGEIELY
nr:peptidoglycan-binding protein [Gemmatimonadota bacterium]